MKENNNIKKSIIEAIINTGEEIPTIQTLEKHIPLERHALGRTLNEMEREGTLYHKKIGKAKIWFINEAPLLTTLKYPTETRTYTEELLFIIMEHIPIPLLIVDKKYNIVYINKATADQYGTIAGQKLYQALFNKQNPLQLHKLRSTIEGTTKKTTTKLTDRQKNKITITARKVEREPHKEIIILLVQTHLEKH